MAEKEIVLTSHAETDFDPELYLKNFDGGFTGSRKEDEWRTFIASQLHEIYKNGTVTGTRLLEIGTGPCTHSIFSAAKWFSEITLSDKSEANLAVLRDWKAGKRQDQKELLQYVLDQEDSREDLMTRCRQVAEKVKYILPVDMRRENMLKGTEVEGLLFDALGVHGCHSTAAEILADLKQNVVNYSRLLKSGGHLVVTDTVELDDEYYDVGKFRFRLLKITHEQFRSSIEEAGFEIIYWQHQQCHYTPDLAATFFAMVARKK